MAIVDVTDNAVTRICGHMVPNCEVRLSVGKNKDSSEVLLKNNLPDEFVTFWPSAEQSKQRCEEAWISLLEGRELDLLLLESFVFFPPLPFLFMPTFIPNI